MLLNQVVIISESQNIAQQTAHEPKQVENLPLISGLEHQNADVDPNDPWEAVTDDSGGIYYWNKLTDETTNIGDAKPDLLLLIPMKF